MRQPCPKLVAPAGGPFDPCELKFCALIGQLNFPWIIEFLVASFLLAFQHCIFFQGIFSFGMILDKYECKNETLHFLINLTPKNSLW